MNNNGRNIKGKKAVKYTEEHLKNSQRVAFRSFVLLAVLVFVSGASASKYNWGSPMIQMFLILGITGIYFMTTSIARNVYLVNPDYTIKFPNTPFLVLSLFSLVVTVISILNEGAEYFIKDGKVADTTITLIAFLFCITPPLITALKKYNYIRKK